MEVLDLRRASLRTSKRERRREARRTDGEMNSAGANAVEEDEEEEEFLWLLTSSVLMEIVNARSG